MEENTPRTIGAFELKKMIVCSEGGSQLLKIELVNSAELEIYDIVVDLPTIKANPIFGLAFNSLEQFRDEMERSFHTLKVTEQGAIIFRLPFYYNSA